MTYLVIINMVYLPLLFLLIKLVYEQPSRCDASLDKTSQNRGAHRIWKRDPQLEVFGAMTDRYAKTQMSSALSGSAGADRKKQQRTHKSREDERARDSAWTG